MEEREAVQRVMARVYKDRVARTGDAPKAAETERIERTVKDAAQRAENMAKRK